MNEDLQNPTKFDKNTHETQNVVQNSALSDIYPNDLFYNFTCPPS